MKKWAVFMAVLCVAMLTACGSSNSAGEDTAHPYSWKEQRSGAVELTIRGAVEEGCQWVVEGTDGGIIQVEKLEKSSEEQTCFSITPLASGISMLSFTCQREGLLEERVFQIVMQLQTDGKGKLTVVGVNQSELAGAASAGQDTENPYAWQMEQEGYLNISIAQSGQEGLWRAMGKDDGIISVSGPIYDDESCKFHVTGEKAGTSKLVLYDPDRGYGIRLQLTVDEAGQITVSEHQEGPYTPSDDENPELLQCKAVVGAFVLPEGSRVERCGTIDWNMDGTDETCEIIFTLNGSGWYCLISKGIAPEEIREEYAEAGQEEVTNVNGCAVTLYRYDEGTVAIWQDQQGRLFRLEYGGDQSTDEVISVIGELTGVRNG